MHKAGVRPHILERLKARRGRAHWFERLDAARSALAVVDMQALFCEPGAAGEVAAARGIIEPLNRLTHALRERRVPVFWVLHQNKVEGSGENAANDWPLFFDHVVADPDVRRRTLESLSRPQEVWRGLETTPADEVLTKNRYSAFSAGASPLESALRSRGIDTLLVAGTKTNVCCDSTARDAMMLGFKSVLVSDCCAALSEEEHQAALETFLQQFGDVLTADEVLEKMGTDPIFRK